MVKAFVNTLFLVVRPSKILKSELISQIQWIIPKNQVSICTNRGIVPINIQRFQKFSLYIKDRKILFDIPYNYMILGPKCRKSFNA